MASHYQTPFGIGFLSVVPSGANPTPIRIAVLKEINVKTTTDFEELYGEEIDPLDAADKSRSTEITAKASGFNALLYAAAMGSSVSTGSVIGVKDESHSVPGSVAYDVSPSVTFSGAKSFSLDCGVIDTTAGIVMTRGATATGAGIYAVNTSTGVYSFNSADANHVVSLSYLYADTATGKTVAIGGGLAGGASSYRLDIQRTYNSGEMVFSFPYVRFGGLSESFGNQKHGEIDLTFKPAKDPTTGKLMNVYLSK